MTVEKSNGTTTSAPITTINYDVENKKKSTITKMESLINEEDEITPEDLAPEGGWGWMIALAMILIFISTIGPTVSFALIFTDFLQASGQEGMASSLFNCVFMITFSIASLLTNMLLKRYSTRPVGIVGALFFAIPDIILAFVRNIYEMAFLFFFQGFGFGLIITVCNTVFNSYFVKKRTKVMSASQVIIGLGGIVFPYLTGKMMTSYGFRGTAAILGAFSLNGVVGMMLMHPVEWHARKPEEIRAERARERVRNLRALALSNRRSTIDVIHETLKTRWSSLRSLKEENSNEVPLLIETLKTSAHRVASISAIEDNIRGRAKSLSMRENLVRRISALSTSSLVNVTASASTLGDVRQSLEKKSKEKQMDIQETEEKEKQDYEKKEKEETTYQIILKDFLDMSLIKNYCFINLCFGTSAVMTADYAYCSLLPLIMSDIGYTTDQASLTLTINGVAELVSKVLLTIMSMMVNVKSKYLFFAAVIGMGFARTGFLLYQHTIMGVFIMTAIIGAIRSWLLVLQPLVIIEDISIEKFATAFGISSVISGIVTIVCGALVGVIKDWTNYDIYQISLLVLNGAFVIPWALQFIIVDYKQWRQQKRAQIITLNSLF